MTNKPQYHPIKNNLIKEYNKIRPRKKRDKLCHAPYKSLFFSQYGEIFACFYNKKEKLGIYPSDKINDIWNGGKIHTLRNYIDNNDLSFGCEDCKRYFEKKNYYSVGAWKYDYLPENKSNYPISFDFQISNKCNLECIMCSGENSELVRKNREKKQSYNNPYDDEFVNQLKPFIPYLKEISFTGGEPFLIDIYYKIMDEIINLNPKIIISITTNGTILNNKVKQYLNKLKFNITLSIDSLNKNNFESIRINANLDKVLENLKYFHNYTKKSKTTINVKICPMQQNWKYIPDLFEYLNNLNIPAIFNNVVFPPYCSLWNLDSNKLNEISNFLSSYSFDRNTANQKDNADRYNNLIKQITGWEKDALTREQNILPDDIHQLKQIFKNKIENYIKTDSTIKENEIDSQLKKYISLANVMFNEFEKEYNLAETIKYFINLPIDRLIGEMEFRTVDKLKERVNQAKKLNK